MGPEEKMPWEWLHSCARNIMATLNYSTGNYREQESQSPQKCTTERWEIIKKCRKGTFSQAQRSCTKKPVKYQERLPGGAVESPSFETPKFNPAKVMGADEPQELPP